MEPLSWQERPLVIGEVAQAHDGSLGMAHAFIDAIGAAGADAVKFQTHIAAAESTPAEPWRVPFGPQDETRYDYWKRMEFGAEQWAGLARHAEENGLAFLSSPFSIEGADLLERVGVAAWKIASGETGNVQLLDRVAATPLPILVSSGMSGWEELDTAVDRIRATSAAPLAVLQCTSSYPTAPEQIGLNVIGEIEERYGVATGLSDHSGTIYPALAAAALGASVIEVHVTMSRDMFGPDVPASVTPAELRQLVEGVRMIGTALASPVDKDVVARELDGMRQTFTRSVVARRDVPAGSVLTAADLALKKPGGGLPPARMAELVGRRVKVALERDQLLTEELLAAG
jgi:N,N'-diacetyllegionaminate synthase